MLLSSAAEVPGRESGWAYEVKWDGFRVLCSAGAAPTRVWSRRGTDFTGAFPELAGLGAALGGRSAIFDGELVAFGRDGRTSFARIRQRWAPTDRRKAEQLSRTAPATLVLFDLLALDGRSLMSLPYEERRRELGQLKLADRHWLVTDYHVGDGRALREASRAHGLEGLVAKRLGSHYRPGQRTGDWLKLKNYQRDSFVIGGWLADGAGALEALLVGRPGERGLVHCGTVEFGLEGQRRYIQQLLEMIPRPDSPFVGGGPPAHRLKFVEPRLKAAVKFIGWDGPVLREAFFESARLRGGR